MLGTDLSRADTELGILSKSEGRGCQRQCGGGLEETPSRARLAHGRDCSGKCGVVEIGKAVTCARVWPWRGSHIMRHLPTSVILVGLLSLHRLGLKMSPET